MHMPMNLYVRRRMYTENDPTNMNRSQILSRVTGAVFDQDLPPSFITLEFHYDSDAPRCFKMRSKYLINRGRGNVVTF